MDNVIDIIESETSSEESSDEGEELLSSNVGVLYQNQFNENEKLMNDSKRVDYENIRNRYFTPEITKRRFTVDPSTLTSSSGKISILDDLKLPTKNIIGFKMYKSNLKNKDPGTAKHVDLIIDEIPEIACMKNETGINIISRIPLILDTSSYYLYEDFVDDQYFHPISLNNLTLSIDNEGFISFEITYLNIAE